MMFQEYVGYAEWALFKEPEPLVSDELRTQMVDADMLMGTQRRRSVL